MQQHEQYDLAIRAVRDCGVIMASTFHPTYSDLARIGLLVRKPLPPPKGAKSLYTLSRSERAARYYKRNGLA